MARNPGWTAGVCLALLLAQMAGAEEAASPREKTPAAESAALPANKEQVGRSVQARSASAIPLIDELFKDGTRKKLDKKVTFEFVDTPLGDAVSFLNDLSGGVNILLDPQINAQMPVSLRVKDMPLSDVLGWLAKIARAQMEIGSQAVYMVQPGEGKGALEYKSLAEKKADQVKTYIAGKATPTRAASEEEQKGAPSGRIRIKLPNGAEFEAEGEVLRKLDIPALVAKFQEAMAPSRQQEK